MSRLLYRQRIDSSACARQLKLSAYTPSLALEDLQTGIDNVRKDVFLSPKFCEIAGLYLAKIIATYGNVGDLVADRDRPNSRGICGLTKGANQKVGADSQSFKANLTELLMAALRRAKGMDNISVDLLARLAVLKFVRSEMTVQFSAVLERCRLKLDAYEGPRQAVAPVTIELRERIAEFQINKKNILRRVGQELVATLREIEKETLARTRRSLFGDLEQPGYELLENRLLFTENGRDDVVNAEHYVMLGNFERDSDRFSVVERLAGKWLETTGFVGEFTTEVAKVRSILCSPCNAEELVAFGMPDTHTEKGKTQRALLDSWVEMLEQEGALDQVIASYEIPALLQEYSPPINPQQLKQALVWREERMRVEQLLEQHGKNSPENFHAAIKRVARCRGAERAKIAGRFLRDFMRYYRDVRRLEVLTAALDGLNLISGDRLRELSAINHSLYEFLLAEEQKPAEQAVIHHVVLKADIRDSSALTRTLFERGLNPASYFGLNFYDPVNKLLPKYEATKLFIEGDAIILALFEREGGPEMGVARACVLAREIIDIVTGYNQKSRAAGLPTLELGIGICFQDSAPMYLMDGTHQIMISPALNESDRLSSCHRSARKLLEASDVPFNVFCCQTIGDIDGGGQPDEFLMRYNIGGINLSEAGFKKLRTEIALEKHETHLPGLWEESPVRLFSGTVRLGPGMFHNLVVREASVPHVDARDFSLKEWTGRRYYEVCTNAAVYEHVARHLAAGGQA